MIIIIRHCTAKVIEGIEKVASSTTTSQASSKLLLTRIFYLWA
jgi:hypothetical protein